LAAHCYFDYPFLAGHETSVDAFLVFFLLAVGINSAEVLADGAGDDGDRNWIGHRPLPSSESYDQNGSAAGVNAIREVANKDGKLSKTRVNHKAARDGHRSAVSYEKPGNAS
jgi:hypothetical protein